MGLLTGPTGELVSQTRDRIFHCKSLYERRVTVLDNKTPGNRNSVDPFSAGIHHLQGWNIVLPKNGETLIHYGSEENCLEMAVVYHLVTSATMNKMRRLKDD